MAVEIGDGSHCGALHHHAGADQRLSRLVEDGSADVLHFGFGYFGFFLDFPLKHNHGIVAYLIGEGSAFEKIVESFLLGRILYGQ